MLPVFADYGKLQFDVKRLDEGDGIFETLKKRNACYHHKCYLKFNKKAQEQAKKSFMKFCIKKSQDSINEDTLTQSSKILRSSSSSHFPNKEICCICGEESEDKSEPLHAAAASVLLKNDNKKDKENVVDKTEQWREMATVLNHSRLLSLTRSPCQRLI